MKRQAHKNKSTTQPRKSMRVQKKRKQIDESKEKPQHTKVEE